MDHRSAVLEIAGLQKTYRSRKGVRRALDGFIAKATNGLAEHATLLASARAPDQGLDAA